MKQRPDIRPFFLVEPGEDSTAPAASMQYNMLGVGSRNRFNAKQKRPGFPAAFYCWSGVAAYLRLEATKSQFTRFQNASMYFGRALR